MFSEVLWKKSNFKKVNLSDTLPIMETNTKNTLIIKNILPKDFKGLYHNTKTDERGPRYALLPSFPYKSI